MVMGVRGGVSGEGVDVRGGVVMGGVEVRD